jgi:hypothetical protein
MAICQRGIWSTRIAAMSAVERAIEKVKRLDEARARQLLAWLQAHEPVSPTVKPAGASAVLGFARRFRAQARTTADWMAELREGDRD